MLGIPLMDKFFKTFGSLAAWVMYMGFWIAVFGVVALLKWILT